MDWLSEWQPMPDLEIEPVDPTAYSGQLTAAVLLIVIAAVVALLWYHRRSWRRSLWCTTVERDVEVCLRLRCPLEECAATVTVRTDPDGYPSHRHLDVTDCSLRPSTAWVPSERRAYFTDLSPVMSYISDVVGNPCRSLGVACTKPCLRVLNAAEPGAAEALRCTSGISDGLELARQTLSPAAMRPLWFYSL